MRRSYLFRTKSICSTSKISKRSCSHKFTLYCQKIPSFWDVGGSCSRLAASVCWFIGHFLWNDWCVDTRLCFDILFNDCFEKTISWSWHTDVLLLCNHVKEAFIYYFFVHFCSLALCDLPQLKWLLRLRWRWESVMWRSSITLAYNSVLLHSRAVSWWLRARKGKQRRRFSFNTVSITRLLTFPGRTDSHQEHFYLVLPFWDPLSTFLL